MVETYYNKDTGYYVTLANQRPCSKIEKQGVDIHGHLIEFPWDNDGFSLRLDSYPSHLSKHSKLPSIASPLRRQCISQREEQGDDDDDDEKEGTQENPKHNSLATNYMQTPRPNRQNTTKIMGDSFPYNNDEKFLDRMEQQHQQQRTQKGRLQHVSPLMCSSILEESDILFRSSTITSNQKKSNATASSIGTRKIYSNERSQISESGTLESWKVAKSPLTGMQSPVVIPLPPRTPSNFDDSEFFTPPSSITSSRSYHSIPVPRNADDLKYYSNSVNAKPKSRSYSQYFNPNFTRTKSKGPKSTGLFSKLLKNIKQHFAK
ncbi:hypothetical protein MFLAVUS_007490 [Mucor flavus]|uniref:Uncharacterized protein n=1 Tax=Mucor flavus TaxID=439312 RepID=A0ABP9Z4G7_9FUNG